ncbi:helix-turn-helix domain-containing protein [uncultured Paraglaciecola sp.]|uniref:helix-turn-helix transcriptional regulator n=1 Tax=uncultured Paraglaciecola sp. TaxID=1765024 RepID=UPI002597C27F|nr:helix-turn-helix domain-containing protein [uncultured Paraglaciecola sp.]
MNTVTTNSQFFTDKNVATRYNIGRSTVWDWLTKDQLPSPVKINGRTRWRLSDLENWEKRNFGGAK